MNCDKEGDCLLVIWKDMENRGRHVIGELSRDEKYRFEYSRDGVQKASQHGFSLLIPFPNIEKTYESEELFPLFSSRLPDRRRPDIKNILAKYKMDSYDQFDLLRASRGVLPTDHLEFAEPIYPSQRNISREFYIAGTRHYEFCESARCEIISDIAVGDSVILEPEPENEIDPFAVLLFDAKKKKIGYLPKFYSKEVTEMLRSARKMRCEILSIRDEREKCQECIKAKLIIE